MVDILVIQLLYIHIAFISWWTYSSQFPSLSFFLSFFLSFSSSGQVIEDLKTMQGLFSILASFDNDSLPSASKVGSTKPENSERLSKNIFITFLEILETLRATHRSNITDYVQLEVYIWISIYLKDLIVLILVYLSILVSLLGVFVSNVYILCVGVRMKKKKKMSIMSHHRHPYRRTRRCWKW